ncbi:MAG TPA: RsmD family RNA methyltransferase [Candidatus Saccharimonadales bacterium]|nr:RsmD family RNA methyltransferase [Candidatus Saccharimonadales bacterium]
MRIIAGNLGKRNFDAPKGHRTHPMSEKARGGLFSALGDISGLTVLDAFAGSGALCFEAISRGAKNAVAIDIDKNAVDTIKRNSKSLGTSDKLKVTRANASGWSDNNGNTVFDLVFIAPPYDDLQPSLVIKLAKHLKDSGIFVLDWPGNEPVLDVEGLEVVKQKNYGDAQLVFYKKIR